MAGRKWRGVPESVAFSLRELEQMAESLTEIKETHIEGLQIGRTLDSLQMNLDWATNKVNMLHQEQEQKRALELLAQKGVS